MNPRQLTGPGAFAALRRFVRPRDPAERCDLCGAGLAEGHQHLVEPAHRKLLCCCDDCAVLFSSEGGTRYRRVPRGVQYLSDFHLTDAQWEDLHLPINLAYFFRSSPAGRVLAVYPSPAGATESMLPLESWRGLEAENPVLLELQPDVEALLVNRVGQARDHFRAPMDECYKLVGLIRTKWRGLSGGNEVWEEIGRFFASLKERSHA